MSYKIFPVDDCGAIGLVSRNDKRPYETPPNAWNVVQNGEMHNGAVRVASGSRPIPSVTMTGTEPHNLGWATNNSNRWWLMFGDGVIKSLSESGIVTDVSTALTLTNTWAGGHPFVIDSKTQQLFANNSADIPCYLNVRAITDNHTAQFAHLPNWMENDLSPSGEENIRAKVLVSYKGFLVAGNISNCLETAGTYDYPNMVWWSDLADTGEIADDWNYASATNLAGRTLLGSDTGGVIAAMQHRDDMLLYCERSVYRMQFVGGNYVFRFSEVFRSFGIFGRQCVAEFGNGQHFVITNDDIVIHDGQQHQTIADGRIKRLFFDHVGMDNINRDKVHVGVHNKMNQVWITYTADPESNTPISRFLIWSWDDNTWEIRDNPDLRCSVELPKIITETVAPDGALTFQEMREQLRDNPPSPDDDTPVPAPAVSGEQLDDWSMQSGTFGSTSRIPPRGFWQLVGAGVEDIRYLDDPNVSQFPILHLEAHGINISGDNRTQTVIAIYPRVIADAVYDENGSAVNPDEAYLYVFIGAMDTPDQSAAEIDWDPPPGDLTYPNGYPVTSEEYKVPVKVRGRRHALKFVSAGRPVTLSGYDLEYTDSGRR
jgi:hypothetical protein